MIERNVTPQQKRDIARRSRLAHDLQVRRLVQAGVSRLDDVEAAARLSRPSNAWPDELQLRLALLNTGRLDPALPDEAGFEDVIADAELRVVEREWINAERRRTASFVEGIPTSAIGLGDWLARAAERWARPSAAFRSWIAERAPLEALRWIAGQERAIATFVADLLAVAQMRMPRATRCGLARRVDEASGSAYEIEALVGALGVAQSDAQLLHEGLALTNLLVGVASNRRFAFHAMGALAAHTLTSRILADALFLGVDRLGVPLPARFAPDDWRAWSLEVFAPLLAEDPRRARAVAEGAVLRMRAGARCLARYDRRLQT